MLNLIKRRKPVFRLDTHFLGICPGLCDLLATGTISGKETGSEGCLLEKRSGGTVVRLTSGETRRFFEDGNSVIFRAYAAKEGLPRIGFGECAGTVIARNDGP